MREIYRIKCLSDDDASAPSSPNSLDSHDELFCSGDSNYSDCEHCEESRWRRCTHSNQPRSTPSTSYHTATEANASNETALLSSAPVSSGAAPLYNWGNREDVPLLGTAVSYAGYRSLDDSLGRAKLTSKTLPEYRKLEKQKKPEKKKQSSLVTIFSLWNTTMGSSLLTMSWGVARAGLLPALLLLVVMGGLCLFTAYLLLRVNKHHGGDTCEVPALCRSLLGVGAERLAHFFSLLVLVGANVVYWILITNFLYFSVNYFMDLKNTTDSKHYNTTIFCPKNLNSSEIVATEESPYWKLHSTVPLYVAVLLFPLMNFKSATFFTKFNSLGTLSVLYLLIFVCIKSATWGVNISPELMPTRAVKDAAVLSGMLALSFYIHNIIITIMNSNRNQENNGRDLTIAFVLVTLTYTLVGAGFYVCFPLVKTCIEDNILNNFEMHDVLTAVARILLLFQVITVYPLVAFMLRCEALLLLPLSPSYRSTMIINVCIIAICVVFAICCPNIGTIIRYTGAVSGLVHIFALPSLLHIRSLQIRGQLTILKGLMYGFIILLGALNLVMQFFISD